MVSGPPAPMLILGDMGGELGCPYNSQGQWWWGCRALPKSTHKDMWLASGEPGSGARQHKEALEKKFGDTTAHGALGEQCHKLHHVHRCHGKFPLIPGWACYAARPLHTTHRDTPATAIVHGCSLGFLLVVRFGMLFKSTGLICRFTGCRQGHLGRGWWVSSEDFVDVCMLFKSRWRY
jgi:hypothetical protein